MQNTPKDKRKIVIKKANKVILKSKKKKYTLGKHGPYKMNKRVKSAIKRVKKIKVLK